MYRRRILPLICGAFLWPGGFQRPEAMESAHTKRACLFDCWCQDKLNRKLLATTIWCAASTSFTRGF